MWRRAGVLVSLCGAVAVVVGSGLATAAPPDVYPPEPDDVVTPFPDACGDFGVTIAPEQGKVQAIFFADGRAFFHTPGAKYRVTADNSDRYVVVQGTGAFHDQPAQAFDPPMIRDGVEYVEAIPTKMTGHNLLIGSIIGGPDDEPTTGVFAVRGKATTTLLVDVNGIFTFADVRGGTITDLCPMLR